MPMESAGIHSESHDGGLLMPDIFDRPYICGIGGVGVSSVAILLLELGRPVCGSDLRASELTELVCSHGGDVCFRTRPEGVKTSSCLIVPAFFPKNHPEVEAAKQYGVPILCRSEALALLCRFFVDEIIVCCGTPARSYAAAMLRQI